MSLNPKDHPVGTRFIGAIHEHATPYELTVREWSPAGEFVKLVSSNKAPFWCASEAYHCAEKLPPELRYVRMKPDGEDHHFADGTKRSF